MNGCLFKTLLIMAAFLALLIGYPYLTKYTSQSMQAKISNLETKGTVIKKFVNIITNKKSKEIQQNDNTENKETTE
jgi:hypothetical protein